MQATTEGRGIGIGGEALKSVTTGDFNTGLGHHALTNITTGANNTAVGYMSLINAGTSSSDNISLGYSAGSNLTSGSNNIIIGSSAQPSSSSASNETVIGNSSTVSANIKGTLKSNGQVLAIAAKSAAYTALVSDEIITGDATSAAFTITLPTAVGKAGQTYTIKRINSGANAVTVGTTSSQTIDGAATYALSAQYKYVKVVSDGANWIIVGNN